MGEYYVSELKIQKQKKRHLLTIFWRYGILFLVMIYILFIGKTLDLGSAFYNILFFIFLIGLAIVVDQFTLTMFTEQIKNQSFKLTETELIKFEKGKQSESFLIKNLAVVKENNKGIIFEDKSNKKRIFISTLIENYDNLHQNFQSIHKK